MYFTCATSLKVNDIKYHPKAWPTIGIDGVYMFPDRFKKEITASPGFLIIVHPKLVIKDTLIAEIKDHLNDVELNQDDKVVRR